MGTARRLQSPVYRWHAGSDPRWLLLCDHASNRVPPALGNLGLSAEDLRRHIAWDIGAADVARQLARQLRAPLIEHRMSRLVIDANRGFDDPTLIPASSDGIPIPGNRELAESERLRRWRMYHEPYHARIQRHLDHLAACRIVPFVVAVHSFTPCLGEAGVHRPWPVGVLWRDDPRIAHVLIHELARDGTLIGDNQPYNGHVALGYTVAHHAIRRGLPHTMIELRQDQLGTPAGRARWAARLHAALQRTAAHAWPHGERGHGEFPVAAR